MTNEHNTPLTPAAYKKLNHILELAQITYELICDEQDVAVLDDVMPAIWPSVNTLAIHTVNTNWFPGWETVKAPAIVDWKSSQSA